MRSTLRRSFGLTAIAASLSVAVPMACGGDGNDMGNTGIDASLPKGGGDAGVGDASSDASTPGALFRLAHLSPDVGRVDVCYRTSPSEAFTGPLILGVPSAVDAGPADVPTTDAGDAGEAGDAEPDADASTPPPAPPGVTFPGVTGYFALPASGSIEIAVVRAVDGNCSTPRARQLLTLDPGKRTTVALMGLAQADAGTRQELTLVPFVDDAMPAAGSTRTRFIHAALGGGKSRDLAALAIEAIDQSTVVPLAARVEPAKTASPSTTDPAVGPLGYHDGQPLAVGALHVAEIGDGGADAQAVSWLSAVTKLDLRAGATHTGFVVSDPTGDLAILLCDDADDDAGCTLVRP